MKCYEEGEKRREHKYDGLAILKNALAAFAVRLYVATLSDKRMWRLIGTLTVDTSSILICKWPSTLTTNTSEKLCRGV